MPSPSPRAARISSLRVQEGLGIRVALRGRGASQHRVLFAVCCMRKSGGSCCAIPDGVMTPSL